MSDRVHDMDVLIGRVLSGEATEHEREQLNTWMLASEANRKHFEQLKFLFEETGGLRSWQQFNTDKAWAQLKQQLQTEKGGKQIRLLPIVWRVAASILVALGIGYFAYTQFIRPQDKVVVAAVGSPSNQVLPDGTEAFLNKSTTLAYEYNPVKKKRVVKLKGEAHFEIKPAAHKSFVIEAGEVTIEDIGTVFNVDAYPDQQTVQVYVESGEVAFFTQDNPGIRLTKGETGVYNKATKSFAKLGVPDENILSYKTGVFVFHDSRLEDVINSINEVYDTKLALGNPKLADCRITVTFRDEKIEVIAEVIAETLKLTSEKKDQEIILNGDGCNN